MKYIALIVVIMTFFTAGAIQAHVFTSETPQGVHLTGLGHLIAVKTIAGQLRLSDLGLLP